MIDTLDLRLFEPIKKEIVITLKDLEAKFVYLGKEVQFDNIDTEIYALGNVKNIHIYTKNKLINRQNLHKKRKMELKIEGKMGVSVAELKTLLKTE